MKSDLRHARIWSGIGWLAVIAAIALSLMPDAVIGAGSLNDKLEHGLGYALLTVWFCGIYPRSRYWVIAAGFLFMGITIETLQDAMHWGRRADVHDVYANAIGIALGALLSWVTPLGTWARRVEHMVTVRWARNGRR